MEYEIVYCGLCRYDEMRRIQEDSIGRIVENAGCEKLFVCEHTPVITVGSKARRLSAKLDVDLIRSRGIEIKEVDRGGEITYHGPGQLVLYPVINIRARRLGVRSFTLLGLDALVTAVSCFGIEARSELSPAGVWINSGPENLTNDSKIASVGLRLVRGVVNHGFSLNVCCDLEPFSLFSPCGLDSKVITNLCDVCYSPPTFEQVQGVVVREFSRAFFRTGPRLEATGFSGNITEGEGASSWA